MIFSGYYVLPGKRYYWDSRPDLHQDFVAKFMTRHEFFHCPNKNNPNLQDEIRKLRTLIDKIQNKNMEHFISVQNLPYDKSSIEYFCRHDCKQCIREKPKTFQLQRQVFSNTYRLSPCLWKIRSSTFTVDW